MSNPDRGILTFLREGLFATRTTGTITPSTPALAKTIATLADVRSARVVVEFGPGTGAITEVLLSELQPDSTFLAIEINPKFVEAMRRRFPSVRVIQDTAANVPRHLEELGIDGCDCIVSGLPWALFDEPLQDQILEAVIDVLRPGGRFVTFTYVFSPWTRRGRRFRRKLFDCFDGHVDLSRVVWTNAPPAFAYCARKPPLSH